jgi:predicted Zn-dependent peptidase
LNNYKLENGVRFIYEYREGTLTSFCIGFEAGALMEDGYKLGTAHALEHMLFKGTKSRTEVEINKQCDEVFGFNNAMTNYPYSIYYGTTLSSDFIKGFELYSDVVLNPIFPEEGFKEEIDVICEELKEWKDDLIQYCEDELLKNSFQRRRIKDLIIGTEKSVRSITLEDLKSFYKAFYSPKNCVISVVTSLSFKDVLNTVENIFGKWNKSYNKKELNLYENNVPGIFIKEREGINGAKIQYLYPIHELNERELKVLSLFNLSFGEGTSSLLYDIVRTKNGLAYDIGSSIKSEKGIKLFVITLSTSLGNVEAVLKLIDDTIKNVNTQKGFFTKELIERNSKIIKLKRELLLEKSIVLCKNLTTYQLMYNSSEAFFDEIEELSKIEEKEILEVISKVLVQPSIQVIKPV